MALKQPLLAPLLLLALAGAQPGLAVPLSDLRDPRPGGWVLDQVGALSADTEAALQSLGRHVKAETGAEIVVVAIDTTGGRDPHAFAVELFNRWRLGDSRRNDGLLLLAAIEDRAAEIVLGDGIDSTQNRSLSERIMQASMVPLFRRGDPEGALVAGARACAEQILRAVPLAAETSPGAGPIAAPPGPVEAPPAQRAVPAPAPAPRRPASGGDLFAGCSCLVALAAAVLAFLWLLRRIFRRRPRACPRCKAAMVQMDEVGDDSAARSRRAGRGAGG